MRLFAASPQDATPRKAVPIDLLRRLAFGRPHGRSIQTAPPEPPTQAAAPVDAAPKSLDDSVDLDQRVRQSGEW